MALFWRIWAAVSLLMLAVMIVFVGLATLQFGNVNSDLVGERLAALAGRTAAPFAAAAGIGLPLSVVRNADALLERARQTDDAIVAIHVFDADGRIIQSTASPAPSHISREAANARAEADGASWHRETSEGFVSSIDIRSQDEKSAGGILVVYPSGGSLIRLHAMAAELALIAIGVLLAGAVLSAVLLRLGLRHQIRLFEEIDGAILGFERAAWRGAMHSPAEGAGAGAELGRLLAEAEVRYLDACRALASAEDESRCAK
jgi:hypothetical protein